MSFDNTISNHTEHYHIYRIMRLRNLFVAGFMLLSALAAAAMTDAEVIAYIRQQTAAGKSQQQIGRELMAKGVTPEQVERLRAQFHNQGNSQSQGNNTNTLQSDRTRDRSIETQPGQRNQRQKDRNQQNQEGIFNQQNRQNMMNVLNTRRTGGYDVMPSDSTDGMYVYDLELPDPENEVYGHRLFNSQALTFEPNENIATPQNYLLGPGDEVIIDIWGASENHVRSVISPEGSIMVEQLGPVYLNGLTVAEANKKVRSAFANRYAGVGSEQSDVNLTLGQVRTIQVDVMGEVMTPGSFRLSPFSTVFHALYSAGGINDIGTMRNVEVRRNGRKIAEVDVYDFLFKGKTGNIRLQEGDVILVPPHSKLIKAEGNVRRPMYYELQDGETLADLLRYAGGFAGDAYSGMVSVERHTGQQNELITVEASLFPGYKLADGDVVSVAEVLDRYSNRVELQGAVMRPGAYALGNGVTTLKQLIKQAEGLSEDAYLGRALIYREGEDLTPEAISFDLGAVMNGRASDVQLRKNDVIIISSMQMLKDYGELTINGPVTLPGRYEYAKGMTLADLILQAGGLLQGASTARIDVARRVVDPAATTESQAIAHLYTFQLLNGLDKSEASDFELEPYDVVEIRFSPGYNPQRFVNLRGEVLFPGEYTLAKRNERLSDVVKRAGGVVDGAYLRGASLRRKMTEDQRRMLDETMRLAKANASGADSIAYEKLDFSDLFNVGIDLEKALQNPGSTYDLVLQEGDELFVPEEKSTVQISGDVLFPNTVVYVPGKKVKYYVEQAGGFGTRARKGSVFIVYMNGQVARAGKSTVVEPGAQIIVPSKGQSSFDWTKVMSIVSMFGSSATMAASFASLFRK